MDSDLLPLLSLVASITTLLPEPGGSVRFKHIENEPGVLITLCRLGSGEVIGRTVLDPSVVVAADKAGTIPDLARSVLATLRSDAAG